MNSPIAACPNPECGVPCSLNNSKDVDAFEIWVDCCTKDYAGCGYSGPRVDAFKLGVGPAEREAIRLHNLVCRPNPETQAVDIPRGLIEALRDHQTQCDEDGVECQVSRQAVDEAVAILSNPLYRSPMDAVPVEKIRELEADIRIMAKESGKYRRSTELRLLECADRLSAVIRGAKT